MKIARTSVTHPTAGMGVVYMLLSCISGVSLLPSLYGHVPEAEVGEAGVLMRCKGSNLTLNEPDLGVTVLHVFVSRGGESLASSSVPATGQFQDRLIVEDDGRVTLSSLTPDDLGKYRVEIQQPEDRHIQRSLRLVISEPPETTDGTLAVNKLLSPTNNSVRLTCGNFTSLGFPRVSVLWKDTRGNILPSDGFEEQIFYLDLPLSSVVSGNYCCHLDCRAPDFCCLDPQSPLRQCAPVHVQTDTVEEDRKVDCPSLDSFSRLQQQVLDLAASLRELQESESQSGVATIAQLVQRQAFVDLQTEMDNKLARLEGKLTLKLSELVTTTAENLNRSAQDSASLEVGCASQLSELKDKLSTIQDTLTSYVTNSSQLHDSLRSDVATTQSLIGGVCTSKSGYRSFNERCIKISNDSVNYQTAKANCLSEEAHLVILKSRDVDAPVLRGVMTATKITVPSPPDFHFWVGADDISTEGSFVWNDGSPFLNSSSLWNTGEPNNKWGNEDCVEIYIYRDLLALHDNNCGKTFRYICEYEP